MFNIGDIIELTKDVLFYNQGLICKVLEIDEDNSNYGWVEILKDSNGKLDVGKRKHANLTIFKLVRRGGFYV